MAAPRGRRHRPPASTATIYARVSPENHAKAHAAAKALGISVAAYIDEVLRRVPTEADGRPEWAEEFARPFEEFEATA